MQRAGIKHRLCPQGVYHHGKEKTYKPFNNHTKQKEGSVCVCKQNTEKVFVSTEKVWEAFVRK